MMKKLVGFFLLITLSFTTNAQKQSSEIIDNFIVAEVNGKIHLSWQINQGNTCNGIQIYRSINNSNFIEIGEIPGICGSSSVAINYSFTDDFPVKNKVNYYQLELGGYGESEILEVEVIDVQTEGFQIRPHPVNTRAKIYFSNPKRKNHRLRIYNTTGKEVSITETRAAYFEISASNYQTGIYFFTIQSASNTLITSGKIVFQ